MTISLLPNLLGPDRTIIPCMEYGVIKADTCDVLRPDGELNIAPSVLGKYVDVDFKNNALRLTARGVSGLIPLNDKITIQVRPRFPLRNLTHIVTMCGYAPTAIRALRAYESTDQWSEWVLDVMADGLLDALDTIVQNGLLRAYHRRAEEGSYIHGHIDTTTTMLRFASHGVNHRAHYSWFERSIDNGPNRCLKSALLHLHRRYANTPSETGARRRLARIAASLCVLEEVPECNSRLLAQDPQVYGTAPLPEARAYYRVALDLALAILRGDGFILDSSEAGEVGKIAMPSLLVHTERLFEEFVRTSLQNVFVDDSDLSVLDGNVTPGQVNLYEEIPGDEISNFPRQASIVDSDFGPRATPDIVFQRRDSTYPLIADVKYTNIKKYANRTELEQVLLYGERYRSPIVMTIHPRRSDSKSGLYIAGRIGTTLITQYRVDLGAEDLEGEMREMGSQIRELISS